MKKIFLLFLLLITLVLNTNIVLAAERTYVGDQNLEVLGQDGLSSAIEMQTKQDKSIIPFSNYKSPNDSFNMDKELIALKWPIASYFFMTAPSNNGGLLWGKMDDAAAQVLDAIANLMFFLPKIATLIGTGVLMFLFTDILASGMCNFVSDGVKIIGANLASDHLSGMLFSLALVLLGACVALYIFKGSIMKAFTNIFVAIICLVGFYVYVSNVNGWIPGLFNFINNATGLSISATTFVKYAPAPLPDATYSGGQESNSTENAKNILIKQGLANCTNAVWHVFVAAPWALGEFGTSDPSKLQLTSDQVKYVNDHITTNFTIGKMVMNPGKTVTDLILSSITGQSYKSIPEGTYVDTLWLASNTNMEATALAALTAQDIGSASTFSASGMGTKSGIYHLFVAYMALLPPIIFVGFVLIVGLPVFFAQVMIMIMLFIMPLALILGMAGDGGIKLLIRFLKTFLGFAATKIVYGFYIGLTLMLAMVISQIGSLHDSPGTTEFLLAVLFGFAIYYHKKFFNAVMSIFTWTPGPDERQPGHIAELMAFTGGEWFGKARSAGQKVASKFPKNRNAKDSNTPSTSTNIPINKTSEALPPSEPPSTFSKVATAAAVTATTVATGGAGAAATAGEATAAATTTTAASTATGTAAKATTSSIAPNTAENITTPRYNTEFPATKGTIPKEQIALNDEPNTGENIKEGFTFKRTTQDKSEKEHNDIESSPPNFSRSPALKENQTDLDDDKDQNNGFNWPKSTIQDNDDKELVPVSKWQKQNNENSLGEELKNSQGNGFTQSEQTKPFGQGTSFPITPDRKDSFSEGQGIGQGTGLGDKSSIGQEQPQSNNTFGQGPGFRQPLSPGKEQWFSLDQKTSEEVTPNVGPTNFNNLNNIQNPENQNHHSNDHRRSGVFFSEQEESPTPEIPRNIPFKHNKDISE